MIRKRQRKGTIGIRKIQADDIDDKDTKEEIIDNSFENFNDTNNSIPISYSIEDSIVNSFSSDSLIPISNQKNDWQSFHLKNSILSSNFMPSNQEIDTQVTISSRNDIFEQDEFPNESNESEIKNPIFLLNRGKRNHSGVSFSTETQRKDESTSEIIQKAKLDMQRNIEFLNQNNNQLDQNFEFNNKNNSKINLNSTINKEYISLDDDIMEIDTEKLNYEKLNNEKLVIVEEKAQLIETNSTNSIYQKNNAFINENIDQQFQKLNQDNDEQMEDEEIEHELQTYVEEEYHSGTKFGLPEPRKNSLERQNWSKKYEEIDEEIDLTMNEIITHQDNEIIIESNNNSPLDENKFMNRKNKLNFEPNDSDIIFSKEVINLTNDYSDLLEKYGFKNKFQFPSKSVTDQQIDLHIYLKNIENEFNTEFKKIELLEEGIIVSQNSITNSLSPHLEKLNTEHAFYQEMWAYTKELLESMDYLDPISNNLWNNLFESMDIYLEGSIQYWNKEINAFIFTNINSQQKDINQFNKGVINFNQNQPLFIQKLTQIQHESDIVLKQIDHDFSSIHRICSEFEKWIERYPKSYVEANIQLEKVISPLMKLRLLNWNPFKDTKFSSIEFYNNLEDFGNIPQQQSLLLEYFSSLSDKLLEEFHELAIKYLCSFITSHYDPTRAEHNRIIHEILEKNPLFSIEKYKSMFISCLKSHLINFIQYIPNQTENQIENQLSQNIDFPQNIETLIEIIYEGVKQLLEAIKMLHSYTLNENENEMHDTDEASVTNSTNNKKETNISNATNITNEFNSIYNNVTQTYKSFYTRFNPVITKSFEEL